MYKWLWLLFMRLCLFELRAGGRKSLWGFLLLTTFPESHIEGMFEWIFLNSFHERHLIWNFLHACDCPNIFKLSSVSGPHPVLLWPCSAKTVSHSHCLLSSLTIHPNLWLHWRICIQCPLASLKYALSSYPLGHWSCPFFFICIFDMKFFSPSAFLLSCSF